MLNVKESVIRESLIYVESISIPHYLKPLTTWSDFSPILYRFTLDNLNLICQSLVIGQNSPESWTE